MPLRSPKTYIYYSYLGMSPTLPPSKSQKLTALSLAFHYSAVAHVEQAFIMSLCLIRDVSSSQYKSLFRTIDRTEGR